MAPPDVGALPSAVRATDATAKRISVREVAKHARDGDAWVIYREGVYNVTDFIASHPGGADVLLGHVGTDITAFFHGDAPGIGAAVHEHTDTAVEVLNAYRIGTLAAEGRSAPSTATVDSSLADILHVLPSQGEEDDEDDLIDLHKPVVSQLWNNPISLKQYLKMVHAPRFLKGGRVARFFENDFLEMCSRNRWYSVLGWVPVAMAMVWQGAKEVPLALVGPTFVAGVVLWTLTEYSIHRWLFHFDNWLPDSHFFICMHFLLHGVHHFLPMDPLRLVFPWTLTLIMLILYYHLLFAFIASTPYTLVLVAGSLSGYVMYDLTHFYLHHAVPQYKYFQDLKTYHLNHHYKNFQLGYGISSKFWDYVFGTVMN